MKKLFTTILMMGVALCTWADPSLTGSLSADGKTLTITYEADAAQPNYLTSLDNPAIDHLAGEPRNWEGVETLVLVGDFANKDLPFIASKFVDKCCKGAGNENKTIFLDLSACTGMKSTVVPTADNNPVDWTSDAFNILPDGSTTSYTVDVTKNDVSETTYVYKANNNDFDLPEGFDPDDTSLSPFSYPGYWGDDNSTIIYDEEQEQWYIYAWSQKIWITKEENTTTTTTWTYEDENGATQTLQQWQVTDDGDGTYSYTYSVTDAAFKLSGDNFDNKTDKLGGIAFPDNANFTAIPDNVFGESGAKNLTSATVGSDLVWIGQAAFKNSKLTEFDFPEGLKVIGPMAFETVPLEEIDLGDCTSLVAIKYEAFEECTSAETLTFPSGSTFTFLGNDAFNKTGITSVDMSECDGITEFQDKQGDGKTYKTFSNCTSLKTVILPPNLTAVPDDSGDGVFYGCGAIETLTFTGTPVYNDCELQNPCTIGHDAFAFNRSLSSITLSKNIQYIGVQAFHSAAITKISIPASVDSLAKHSFYGCTKLTTVIFEEFDKQYGTCDGAETKVAGAQGSGGQGQGAFEECQNITDVYINTMAELQCDNNAFDQDISWGAGDAGANFATLHFPKEKTEHYANLSHYLTDEIVTNPGLFHDWLEDHYDQAINPHKNGWYEFINSGPSTPEDGPEYQSIILRTFSDYDYAYLVPSGLRAYVVNAVKPVGDNYEVTLQRLNVIPKRTGVILYGHPNGKTQGGKPALVLTPVKFLETGDPLYDQKYVDDVLVDCDIEYNEDGTMVVQDTYRGPDQGAALCRANWDNLDESHAIYKNYLEPILSADGSTVAIKPYETVKVDGVKKTTFRNFALGRYTSTDYFSKDESTLNDETNYVGFFRMKNQKYKSGYAYLRLTGDVDAEGNALENPEFAVSDGGEILVKPDEPTVDLTNHVYPYYYEVMVSDGNPYNARAYLGDETYNPKRWWDDTEEQEIPFTWREYSLSWGDRSNALVNPSGSAKYYGELEENADGIVKLVIPAGNEDGEYYTLQGVRVSNPTKGVYIQNGKKVIIK